MARRQTQSRKSQKKRQNQFTVLVAYKSVLTVFPIRFRPFPLGGRSRARPRWVQAEPSPGPRSAQARPKARTNSFACLFRLCLRNHFHQGATFWQIMLNLCRQRFLVVRLAGQLENTFLEFRIKFAKKASCKKQLYKTLRDRMPQTPAQTNLLFEHWAGSRPTLDPRLGPGRAQP